MAQYVKRRNGVPLGSRKSMHNMLDRSLGATTIAGFWRHWNPIWSYSLGRYIFTPLKRSMPVPVALVLTFVASGLIHDAVIMALRGELALLFTPWFLLLGLGVVVSEFFRWNFAALPWIGRASIIVGYAAAALALSLAFSSAVGLWWPAR
jgi:D-alanyl-lipoteichoic acid acyltransferase DltB (MBOAT superfamily)